MYVGQSIKRREDIKFLTGAGQYVDDVSLPEDIVHATYVRSPHPHAKIISISTCMLFNAKHVSWQIQTSLMCPNVLLMNSARCHSNTG